MLSSIQTGFFAVSLTDVKTKIPKKKSPENVIFFTAIGQSHINKTELSIKVEAMRLTSSEIVFIVLRCI